MTHENCMKIVKRYERAIEIANKQIGMNGGSCYLLDSNSQFIGWLNRCGYLKDNQKSKIKGESK